MPPLLVPLSIYPLLAVWVGLLFLFSQQLVLAVWVGLLFLFSQQPENNLFVPRVLSKPLDLHRFPSPSWRWCWEPLAACSGRSWPGQRRARSRGSTRRGI
jgi:hypothetical protein